MLAEIPAMKALRMPILTYAFGASLGDAESEAVRKCNEHEPGSMRLTQNTRRLCDDLAACSGR